MASLPVKVNPGGRPRLYPTAQLMAEACDAYFTQCYEEELPPTVTGLALYLGFSRKQQLYEQTYDAEYRHVVDRARLIVENSYERGLRGQNPTGCIFALKNMQWSDRQEIDVKDDREIKEMSAEVRSSKLRALVETARLRQLEHIEDAEIVEEDWGGF